MAQVLINTTTSPYDSGKAGGDKINAMMFEAYQHIDRSKPTRILIDGDSIGVLMGDYGGRSPLLWAAAQFPFRFFHDRSKDVFAVGGTFSGNTGLIQPARMAALASRATACRAAGENVIVISQMGTNDAGNAPSSGSPGYTDNGTGSTVANYQTWWANAKGAGANRAVIMAIPPRGDSTTNVARSVRAINRSLAEWCRRNSNELAFCDTQDALGIDANELFQPIGGTAVGTTGSVMFDNLHPSGLGGYYQAKKLGPILQGWIGKRTPFVNMAGESFSKTNPTSVRGNILGRQGVFFDTGGSTNVTLSGGGGVTGAANFPSAKLFGNYPGLSGTLSGTLSVAITQEAWPVAIAETGRTDIMSTKLTFSGTPTSDGSVNWSTAANNAGTDFADGPFEGECLLWMAALAGLSTPEVSMTVSASGTSWGGGIYNAADFIGPVNGLFQAVSPTPVTATTNPSNLVMTTKLYFKSGVPCSGSVYIRGQAIVQNPALPAAT
jgi:lysophospholipase L1-like esterase